MPPSNEFSRLVTIEPWPEEGTKAIDLSAEPSELEALARRFDLIELSALRAYGRLERVGRKDIHFRGTLEAEVVQTCVVSLEPVASVVREPIERRYRRVDSPAEYEEVAVQGLSDEPDEEDLEPVLGGQIDLGEATAEQLSLALDPYPHAGDARADVHGGLGPDVSFGPAKPSESPLAAALRQSHNGKRAVLVAVPSRGRE